MSDTDQCSRCGGDCPFNPGCRECGGCENTGVQPCPACQPPAPGYLSDGDWDDEPCNFDGDEEDYASHYHCLGCGGCGCPGYCDDTSTYNLRPAETGGPA